MREIIFIDSFAWIASINKSDNYHEVILELFKELLEKRVKFFTTNYVIVETINALSKVTFRKALIEFVDKLEKSPSVRIIKITNKMYNNAWVFYQKRMDKDWGFTDCTSFEVMRIFNIKKTLTNDKHFEQAGYSLIIKQVQKL
ncbi:PIN domain-containing protein [Candidatus Desantisbacteria bacterium]|nr:PIN domain-containing protein [Candidatus Desantisbacteria bacterium]